MCDVLLLGVSDQMGGPISKCVELTFQSYVCGDGTIGPTLYRSVVEVDAPFEELCNGFHKTEAGRARYNERTHNAPHLSYALIPESMIPDTIPGYKRKFVEITEGQAECQTEGPIKHD